MFLKALAAAVAFCTATGAVLAQDYPTKPIALVIPFAAGGPTDVVAGVLAQSMSKSLGQTVVVDNAVGAGGTIAATQVARARPDGHTIFLHHNGMATSPALYRKLEFVDKVGAVTTPGETVDVIATEAGVAVNPRQEELAERLRSAGMAVVSIERLRELAKREATKASADIAGDRVAAVLEYRDGTVIDVLKVIGG